MIPQGLFTQIGMIIVSIAIVITYIQPIFEEISVMQEDTKTYTDKLGEVAKVNSRLNSLTTQLDSVSVDDRNRLLTYMPTEIDTISVVRDLFLLSSQAEVVYLDASFTDSSAQTGRNRSSNSVVSTEGGPTPHSFSLSVEGSYTDMKSFFDMIEQNNYPFEVHNLDISRQESGDLSANISLVTYAYNSSLISLDDNLE